MKQFWLSLYSLKVPLSPGNLLFNYAFLGCKLPPSSLNKKGLPFMGTCN